MEDTQKTSTPMSKALSGHSYNTKLGQHGQELPLQAVKHSSSGLSIQFMQTKTVHVSHPENRNSYLKGVICALVQHGIGPASEGINPASSKAHSICLIDPVYADKNRTSRNMELLRATSQELGELLDYDPHFAH